MIRLPGNRNVIFIPAASALFVYETGPVLLGTLKNQGIAAGPAIALFELDLRRRRPSAGSLSPAGA